MYCSFFFYYCLFISVIQLAIKLSIFLCVCFVDRCLSFCSFSFGHCVVCSSVFWPLCCLFFFELRILITPLVSSNSSYQNDFH